VILRNDKIVNYLPSRAHKLRKIEEFRDVYLKPDRTSKDQAAHSELVGEMKPIIKNSSKYFIRNGQITC
jgi:hypothetical protein